MATPAVNTETSILTDDTSSHAPDANPIGLVRIHPSGACYITSDILEMTETIARNQPDLGDTLQWTLTHVHDLRHGSIYLVATSPAIMVFIRHVAGAGMPSYPLSVLDTNPIPLTPAAFAPLLEMVFSFDLALDMRNLARVIDDLKYSEGITANPRIPPDRLYLSTRHNPRPSTFGWWIPTTMSASSASASAPPAAHSATLLQMSTIPAAGGLPPILNAATPVGSVSSGPAAGLISLIPPAHTAIYARGHPYYRVDEAQALYRRGGTYLVQQLADTVAGVSGVAKDSLAKTGVQESTVRALSAAPDAALHQSTLSGTHSYLHQLNHWSLPIWDLRFYIANHFQFPDDFNYAMLAPLTLVFAARQARENFQRELREFNDTAKPAYARKFGLIQAALLAHHGDLLRHILNNYLHLTFAVTLMRADLQERFVNIASRMAQTVQGYLNGPSNLTNLLLMQSFSLFRAAMRDFLLQSDAARSTADMADRLNSFGNMVLSMEDFSPLRSLLSTYSELYSRRRQDEAHHADGFSIVPASLYVPGHLDRGRERPVDSASAFSGSAKKKPKKAASQPASTIASASTSREISRPSIAPVSHESAPAATSAASAPNPTPTGTPKVCAQFNNEHGCPKDPCAFEHILPPRTILEGTRSVPNPRWTSLYNFYVYIHARGTARHNPTAAFLQGAVWPPVSSGGPATA